jgi:hypothetical protein
MSPLALQSRRHALFPYLWRYKWRVMVALAFMVGAKLANVACRCCSSNWSMP